MGYCTRHVMEVSSFKSEQLMFVLTHSKKSELLSSTASRSEELKNARRYLSPDFEFKLFEISWCVSKGFGQPQGCCGIVESFHVSDLRYFCLSPEIRDLASLDRVSGSMWVFPELSTRYT